MTRRLARRPALGAGVCLAMAVAVLPVLSAAASANPADTSSPVATAKADAAPATWSFERDAVGAVPDGCRTPAGRAALAVTDEQGFHSRQSLELNDDSTSSIPAIACDRPAQRGVQLTLQANPVDVANGFIIDLMGTTTTRSGVVFHLLVRADGSVDWYDGYRWLQVSAAGTIPQQSWSRIDIASTADQRMVYLSVDGQHIGSAGPRGVDPVTSITGFELAGYGTASVGDRVLFDDVRLAPALLTPPAAIKQQFRFGERHTIITSDEPEQMPGTAVRIPLENGRTRILAGHPAHGDSGLVGGNRLVYSDDGGTTWVDYQEHNPMPDASSFFMTRLADGSLYAMNYHAYHADDPKQAVIESAVSTDNGETWTVRHGLLTAPVDLVPYACERPTGCTANFQVHNVIEDADGTLYQSSYGKYAGDTAYRQLVLVSRDGGLNWSVQATVSADPELSPCEGVLVRTGPHSFLMVIRTGSYQQMYSSRSDDDGKTWTTPEPMTSRSGKKVLSVYPALERLDDGSLLLMVGRPGLSLLRSFDNGQTWSDPVWVDYTNSANGYMLPMGGRSVMVFGDQGADWQHPQEYGVWNQLVTAIGQDQR